jgi:tRNA-Thr(GGU) m(6)t(6)A37 methyltransferase TsaA
VTPKARDGQHDRSRLVRPIGFIRSPFNATEDAPFQSLLAQDVEGEIHVSQRFVAGLDGLDGFDYAHVLTLVDPRPAGGGEQNDDNVELRPEPLLLRGTGRRIGVFATRFPQRPNGLGLSVIRIVRVRGNVITFRGVDVADKTPVVDIKPWVPQFDVPEGGPGNRDLSSVRSGWYASADVLDRMTSRDESSLEGTSASLPRRCGTRPVVHIRGAVAQPGPVTIDAVEQLMNVTVTVNLAHRSPAEFHACTGAWLMDVLHLAGVVAAGDDNRFNLLRRCVRATAGDGRQVTFSMGELDRALGAASVLLCWNMDGRDLDNFRLIVGSDGDGARSIAQLTALDVV